METDYSAIFNKITLDSLDKFTQLYPMGKGFRKGKSKREYIENFKTALGCDLFLKQEFQNFYRETEEAGKKHFFIYRMLYDDAVKSRILSQVCSCTDETLRSFDPAMDDGKVFASVSRDGNTVLIKRISIKKTYQQPIVSEDNEYLVKKYRIRKIHFIEVIQFDFAQNVLIYGYDARGEYDLKKESRERIRKLLTEFIGEDAFTGLTSFLTSEKIENLRKLPNCIAMSISSNISAADKAVFRKSRGDVDRILSELREEKYILDEIKVKNPHLDVQTHPLFEASIVKCIEDDLNLESCGLDCYYFTRAVGIASCFRMRIDFTRDMIMTFSDSVMKKELYDVLARLN